MKTELIIAGDTILLLDKENIPKVGDTVALDKENIKCRVLGYLPYKGVSKVIDAPLLPDIPRGIFTKDDLERAYIMGISYNSYRSYNAMMGPFNKLVWELMDNRIPKAFIPVMRTNRPSELVTQVIGGETVLVGNYIF